VCVVEVRGECGRRSLLAPRRTAVVELTCTSAEAMGNASTFIVESSVGTIASIVL
jgi:hypothetical protein